MVDDTGYILELRSYCILQLMSSTSAETRLNDEPRKTSRAEIHLVAPKYVDQYMSRWKSHCCYQNDVSETMTISIMLRNFFINNSFDLHSRYYRLKPDNYKTEVEHFVNKPAVSHKTEIVIPVSAPLPPK